MFSVKYVVLNNCQLLYCNTFFPPFKGYTAYFPDMPSTREAKFPTHNLAHLKQLKDSTKANILN